MASRDAGVCCDSRSDSIYTWCKYPTLQLPKALYTKTEPPLCFTVGVIQGLQLFHQLFKAHRPSYLSVQRTLHHCSIIQTLCALASWTLLTLFSFLNSGFLTEILPYSPASQSSLHCGCWYIFSRHWFSYTVMFRAVSIQSCWWLMELSSAYVK